jgi:hypothetical protein
MANNNVDITEHIEDPPEATENNLRFIKDQVNGYIYYQGLYNKLTGKYSSIAEAPDAEVNTLSNNLLDFFRTIDHPEYTRIRQRYPYDPRGKLSAMYSELLKFNEAIGGMSYIKRKSKRYRKSKRHRRFKRHRKSKRRN